MSVAIPELTEDLQSKLKLDEPSEDTANPVQANGGSAKPATDPNASAQLFSPADGDGKAAEEDEREYVLEGRSEGYYQKLLDTIRHRVLEGQGETMCKIGVDHRGRPRGLDEADYAASLETVRRIAADLNGAATLVVEKTVKESPKLQCAEVLVRRAGEDSYIDMRIAICGNVDSGKSTFVGVLTKGVLDNGRGSVRQKVFRHKHEADTGRTSSVSEQMMGFDAHGQVVNYPKLMAASDEKLQKHLISSKQISEQSAKILTMYDLAGHEKYLKTTVLGMTGSMPDYAAIIISANNGIQRMTKEHLGLCLALKIPFFVVITRIDTTPELVTKNTTDTVLKLLKHPGVNKLPYMVRTEEDGIICAKNIKDDRIAPIFHLSNVTGDNFELMRKFLNLLPIRKDWYGLSKLPLEVIIDSTYYVPGVGTVVGGIVIQGAIHPNDTVWLGPNNNGQFRQAVVKTIHVKQAFTNRVEAGTAATFALKKERRSDIRKGMVLVDAKSKPAAVWEFEAEIVILYHSTTIQSNYQPVVHCGNVRQSCAIILVDNEVLRTGDKARVKFRFMYKPEYLRLGTKLIFREGRTKGLGTIIDTFPMAPKVPA